MTILSLCDFSGSWPLPYIQQGYSIVCVDTQHPPGETYLGPITLVGQDVKSLTVNEVRERWGQPHGVLAAPPCTCFCRPGARWWSRQDGTGQTAKDVDLFTHVYHLVESLDPVWWALENPPGRHKTVMSWLPLPAWQFQPWWYGDPWVKQTYIWGTATQPPKGPVVTPEPTYRTPNGHSQGRIARMSGSWKAQRAQTPAGFAKAFCRANL